MKLLRLTAIVFGLFFLSFVAVYFLKQPTYTINTEGKLYVLNKASKSISIFDLLKGQEIKELPVEIEPHEATIVANPNRVVITDYGAPNVPGKSVTVINTETNTIENSIDLGESLKPHGIITMPQSNSVGVVSDIGNHLSIVNIDRGVMEKQIATEQDFSHLLVHHPFKPIVYVSNINSGSVSVIDVDQAEVIRIIPCSKKAEGIAITPDGSEIWVTNILDNSITIIDTETYETKTTLETGQQPLRIKFSNDGKKCLVSNAVDGTVSVFDVESKKQITTIAFPGKRNLLEKFIYGTPRPVGILMHPNGSYAFVSNHTTSRVEVIDMKNFAWVSSIPVGDMPDGLALLN